MKVPASINDNNYKKDFLNEYKYALSYPFFAYKKAEKIIKGLTHAKINFWESKGIIVSSRDKKGTGWKKFSISDIIALSIVSDLRKTGFPIEKLKQIMDSITSGQIKIWGSKKENLSLPNSTTLNSAIVNCLFGARLFLAIGVKKRIFFLSKIPVNNFFLELEKKTTPIIILSFYSYIENIVDTLKEIFNLSKNSTPEQILDNILPYEEQRIARWIKNSNYKIIRFKKKVDSKEIIIKIDPKGKRHSLKGITETIREGEYCCLSITTKRGQKITIPREEWVKKNKNCPL